MDRVTIEYYNTSKNRDIAQECDSIAEECYGDYIRNSNIVKDYSDGVICARYRNQIIGYLAIEKTQQNELYIPQMVVKEKYRHKGVCSKMLNYLIEHSKGYDCVVACVEFQNKASSEFFLKFGFENKSLTKYLAYVYKLNVKDIKNRQIFQEKKLDR